MAKGNRRLATTTYVSNPETGETAVLEPGTEESDVPEWAVIDNESAWAVPEGEGEDGLPSAENAKSYDDLKVEDLVQLARDRNLNPESTKKADLITALEEHDKAQQTAEM